MASFLCVGLGSLRFKSHTWKKAPGESIKNWLQNRNSRTGFSVFPLFLEVVIADLKSAFSEACRKNGTATQNIMAFAQPLLVVGCTNRFALCTKQRIGLGCAKGQ